MIRNSSAGLQTAKILSFSSLVLFGLPAQAQLSSNILKPNITLEAERLEGFQDEITAGILVPAYLGERFGLFVGAEVGLERFITDETVTPFRPETSEISLGLTYQLNEGNEIALTAGRSEGFYETASSLAGQFFHESAKLRLSGKLKYELYRNEFITDENGDPQQQTRQEFAGSLTWYPFKNQFDGYFSLVADGTFDEDAFFEDLRRQYDVDANFRYRLKKGGFVSARASTDETGEADADARLRYILGERGRLTYGLAARAEYELDADDTASGKAKAGVYTSGRFGNLFAELTPSAVYEFSDGLYGAEADGFVSYGIGDNTEASLGAAVGWLSDDSLIWNIAPRLSYRRGDWTVALFGSADKDTAAGDHTDLMAGLSLNLFRGQAAGNRYSVTAEASREWEGPDRRTEDNFSLKLEVLR